MDTVKINGTWYEKQWKWTGIKSNPGIMGYSLRRLSPFEAQREEERNGPAREVSEP
jgi:hypothetical protein